MHNFLLYFLYSMQKTPKCVSNCFATFICMNQSCTKPNPFLCGVNHQCKEQHKRCVKIEWIQFKQTIDQNKHPSNPTFKLLCEKVEKSINKCIEQLKSELEYFIKWKEQYGVVEKIAEFCECVELNKEIKWTGKEVCKLENDKRTKFDNVQIESKMIETEVTKIEIKKSELIKIIRQCYHPIVKMYDMIDINSKQQTLKGIIQKVAQLKHQPEQLQLKISIIKFYHRSNLVLNNRVLRYSNIVISITDNFKQLFSNYSFQNLKNITMYAGQQSLIKHEVYDSLCSALTKLPKLQRFTMVVDNIQSDISFAPLGNKFKTIVQKQWWTAEKWKQ